MKGNSDSVVRKLKAARQKVIDKIVLARSNNDDDAQAAWEKRRVYLNTQIDKYKKLSYGSDVPKRVFVSYSKGSGEEYYYVLKNALIENGYSVTSGFENREKSGGVVLRNVLNQMNVASIYVGIYTRFSSMKKNKKKFFMPSVWTIEEKGMALGLGKPVLLIVEEGIHEDFFVKTTGSFRHCLVKNIKHFEYEVINEAIEIIFDKYHDLNAKDNNHKALLDL